MLAGLFIDGNFFSKNILNAVDDSCKTSKYAYREIYNDRKSATGIDEKIDRLTDKYHSVCLYISMNALKDGSITLENYVDNTENATVQFANNVVLSLFTFLIKTIINDIVSRYGYGVNGTAKYTYFFCQSNGVTKGYDGVLIVFSVSNDLIDQEILDNIVSCMHDGICGNGLKKILPSYDNMSSSCVFRIYKYYLYLFIKNRTRVLDAFYPNVAENGDHFSQFVKRPFSITGCGSLFEYFNYNRIRYAYQMKTLDCSSMSSIRFRNVMMPNLTRIIQKAIYDILLLGYVDEVQSRLTDDESNRETMESMSSLLNSISSDINRENNKKKKKTDDIDKEIQITIHRTLTTYRKELRNKILPGLRGGSIMSKSISDVLEKMMFRLYSIFARSPTATISSVGESIHAYRISNHQTAEIEQSYVSHKMNHIINEGILCEYTSYDIYRLLTSCEMTDTFGFRKYIVFIYELLSENIPSIYDNTTKLANNFFIISDPSGGKDLILETIEANYIPNTIMKESRSSACADASESHGRHDDEIIFNAERSLDPMMNSRISNYSGDTGLKDRMTSFRSVSRVLSLGPNGSRQTKVIVNERKVMFYDASNLSVISRIDGGFVDRYTWIFMLPTTYQTSTETVRLVAQQSMNGTSIEDEIRKKMFKDDQHFIQMAAYELSKFTMICHDEIFYRGIYHIIQFIMKNLESDAYLYGCRSISQRKINAIISLSKCHTIRRIVIKHFFKEKTCGPSIYSHKYLYDRVVSKGKFFVSIYDFVLAIGQMAKSMGIFAVAEVQMLTALRCIFIRTEYSARMRDVGHLYRLCKTNPRYVVFPNDPKSVAAKCLEVLLEIWNNEENAPQPVNYDTCLDYITQLFDIDKYNRDACKRPMTRKNDIYSYVHYDAIAGLLYLIDKNIFGPVCNMADQEPMIKKNAKDNTIHIHIRYINRLFDGEMQMFPWTHVMPPTWSPIIDEDALLKHYLELFFSCARQIEKPKKIVYRLVRKRLSNNAFFESISDMYSQSLVFHEFDCINIPCFDNQKPFMMHTGSDCHDKAFPLWMGIDEYSRLNLSLGFDRTMEENADRCPLLV